MNNQIQETIYILPLTFLYNGLVSAPVVNPQYLLLEDTLTAQFGPNGTADCAVGNFNFNIPVGAVVTGIQFTVRARVGSINVPAATLSFNAIDDTSGTIIYYPYTASFSGLTQDLATYTFGSANYLFNTTWSVSQINNFKLQLVGAGGDVFVDDVQAQVFYYIPGTPTPPTPDSQFCLTCESPIQGVEYFLALELTSTATKAYVYNFNYADGTPIQISDLGDCGGVIEVVMDEGQVATNGSNFMENAEITNITRLPSGLVELDFGTINNRGLMFKTPYAHDVNLLSPHSVNAKLIISNSAPYENKKLRQCQKGVVFSAPITVEDEGVTAVTAMETLNFIGPNVQAEVDPMDPTKANVTIIAQATNTDPVIVATSTGTVGSATSLTISHIITTENYLRVWVSTDNQTISGITYNGISMTLVGAETNVAANLKVALYGLINPAVGTHNIVITMASSADISGGGVSFNDVDTITPTVGVSSGAIGSSTAPSDTITTTVQNTVLQDVVGTVINTTAFAQGALWTINSQVNASARPGASSTRKVLVPATVIDTYTVAPTGAWAIIIAGVRGIATPIGGVASVTGLNTNNTDPANPIVGISVDGTSITGLGTPGSPLVAHVTGPSAQTDIQFQDESTNLGTPGSVDTVNFVGAGITATRSGNTVTVTVPGGGSSISLETNGTPNTDQAVLNLLAGSNITLTPDAFGGVTIDSMGTGGGGSGGGELLHSFANSTPTLPPNTTPIVVDSYTIPANTFAVGDVIRITVGITVGSNTSNSGQNDLEIGGTPILTVAPIANNGVTNFVTTTITGVITASTIEFSETGFRVVSSTASINSISSNGSFAFNPAISNTINAVVTSGTLLGGYSGAYDNLVIEKIGKGSGSDTLSVNADENELTNFTAQIALPGFILGGTNAIADAGWQQNGSTNNAGFGEFGPNGSWGNAVQSQLYTNPVRAWTQIMAPSASNGPQLSLDTPNVYRLKFYGKNISTSVSGSRTAIGFSDQTASGSFWSEAATAENDIKFVFDSFNTKTFAVCSNGSAVTSVDLSIDPTTYHLYEIVVTPFTNAKFYVDGVLKTTITTHLYASGSAVLNFYQSAFTGGSSGGGATGGKLDITPPVFSLTL